MTNILNNSKTIFDKICNLKLNKNIYNIILTFVEQLNKDITSEKYIEIIELFLKKIHKSKVVEIKLTEKIYHSDFYENLEDTPEKFISWLFV
jgi:lipoate-protein ligase A